MKEKKKEVGTFRRDFVFTALALIAVGVLFVSLPEKSTELICYITAGLLCAWGIIKLFMYISSEAKGFGSFGLVTSVSLIIGGIAIFVRPEFFAGIIAAFFGCVMVIDGVLKVQYGIDLAKIGAKKYFVVLIIAAVFIILGLLIIFNPFDTAVLFMVFAGISLILNGLSDLFTAIYVSKVLKKLRQKERSITLSDDDYKDVD